MKYLFSTLLILLMRVPPLFSSHTIIETDDIKEIESHLTTETVLFFDLDDVVFTTSSFLGHSLWFYEKKESLISYGLSWEEATAFLSDLNFELQKILAVKPVDERTSECIKLWQKTTPTVGLTSRKSDLSEATERMLRDVDVDFTSDEAFLAPLSLPFSQTSKIQNNVIYVSDYHSKGELVNFFLSKLAALHPQKKVHRVIFIDDKEKYLHEVKDALPESIDFVGLRYSKEDARVALFKQYVSNNEEL